MSLTRPNLVHMARLGPTQIIIKDIKNEMKKFQKTFKCHFKTIVIFTHVFVPILLNIESYIYAFRYKFGTKYMIFFEITKKLKLNIYLVFVHMDTS